MKTTRFLSTIPTLVLLAACSNAPAPAPVTLADEVASDPVAEAGEQSQALDTQGFFQARGYFMNTDTVAGDCIVGADGKDVVPVQAPNTGGQEVKFSLSLLESSSDVQNRLSIKASASVKALVAGGDAKFEFANSTRTSDTSVTLLAAVTVRNTPWTVPPGIKLRDDTLDLLRGTAGKPATPAQLARFRNRCGDGFLHSYTTGGEFFALIQVQTSSVDEKQSISAKIEGNYLAYSGSAEFQKELKKIVSNSSTIVRTYQIGGEGTDTAACSDVECVSKRIEAFTTAALNKPVVFSSEVKPYTQLALPNDATTPTDIATALDQIETINRERNSTRDLLSRLVDVQTNSENYVVTASQLTSIGTAIGSLNGNMNKLNNSLKACGRTPATCSLPSTTKVSVTVPSLKPLPSLVTLRAYAQPSSIVISGGRLKGTCASTSWSQATSVLTRAEADAGIIKVVPSLLAAPGAVSLQSFLQPTSYLGVTIGGRCSQRLSLAVPSTSNAKERATFYRVKGLNGKPNTWSFRLYATADADGVGGTDRNRDSAMYLSTDGVGPIAVYTYPPAAAAAADVSAYKDAVSWYLDEQ